ncbi:MAG: Uma2 family endonuclease [Deltaproteobacteria bacterium]|nr:Uma2 family endonuclease [Deltaproteobacteria bacterium]
MGLALKKEKYTWQDYLDWSDDERWEVIEGVAYNMTPSPSFTHQKIAGNVYGILRDKLRGKPCTPAIAPLDVYLDDINFVQPDVMVVCDKNKLKEKIYGAPDVIIEVLSPHTSLKDKREKKALYERNGVKEYVIVDPLEQYVERFLPGPDGSYSKGDVFGPKEVLPLKSLDGLEISLWEVFEVEGPEKKLEISTSR